MPGSSARSKSHIPGTARHAVEWPTWLLIAAVYGGWLALTCYARVLPWWVLLPAGAWICAWHHSLQHELIHNHPTRKSWLNTLIGFAPVGLWLPYLRYRAMHLSHHRNELLTDPLEDPESYYLTEVDWQARGPVSRAAKRFLNTAAGRIPFGPAVAMSRFLADEIAALVEGAPGLRWIWAIHALGVVAVLVWVGAVCAIPFWKYCFLFVYPGCVLTAVRSMAEHRAAVDPHHRTAIVERAPVFGLLFLFNNLHVVHHRHPGMPWYAIPRCYRQHRAAFIRRNDGLVYRGYLDVMRRYLVREHHAPVYPAAGPSEEYVREAPVGGRLGLQPAPASP